MGRGPSASALSLPDLPINGPPDLSERDEDIIEAYLARRTLIEALSEESAGEE